MALTTGTTYYAHVPTDELPCGTWNGVLFGVASFLVGGIVTATALIIWAYKG